LTNIGSPIHKKLSIYFVVAFKMVSTRVHVINKLFLGGLNYLFCKFSLELLKGEDGKGKACLLTFSSFFSLFLIGLPIYGLETKQAKNAAKAEGAAPYSGSTWAMHALAAIPGVFEFIAVLLSMYANSFLPATIMVFMKATRVLWSALMSKYALGKVLYGYHWLGVALTFIGLAPIIMVQQITPKHEKDATQVQFMTAIAAVFLCEFFRAIRVILEEKLMKEKNYSCSFVQLVEGYTGLILTVIAMIVAQFQGWEDNTETLSVMKAKPLGCFFFVLHTLIHGTVNYSSNYVTKLLSSVHNAIISEMRIAVVWGPEFLIYLVTQHTSNKIGKHWSYWHFLDIPGFLIIAASAFIYSGILKVKFMPSLYPALPATEKDLEKVASPTTNDCCSEKACASH
jgi:drug/metabolite transporter (DMT)-like permease